MPAGKGECWNESESWRDSWTLRACRRLTTLGEINQTPNYHTNIGFTADSEFLVFWTLRENMGAFCKVEVATGDITQLTEAAADYRLLHSYPGRPLPAHVPGAAKPLAGVHRVAFAAGGAAGHAGKSARSSPTPAPGSRATPPSPLTNSALFCRFPRCILKLRPVCA